jgi:predicted RND superfamily exporter protein
MLRIYPRAALWDPAERQAFIDEVRSVIPEVSGVPVLLHESSRQMARGYLAAGVYAFAAVVVLLLLHFRSLRNTLLALLALLLGGLWLAGLMAACRIDLNPANLIALPLLLGIGIDTAVHVIHRGSQEGPGAPLVATSLGRALVYSGLTSVASFGSLMLADHPGTASIGSTISLGVFCCVLAGLTVPPAALQLLARRSGRLAD